MQPYVGIVILNWNKKEYLLNCIRSVKKLEYTNYRLLVVDNASTDGSVTAVKQEFPDVELLIQQENLGGTGGFNAGMQLFLKNDNCKYIYLLDNDITLDNAALSELVKVMEDEPELAIAGSKILIMDNPSQLQEMGARVDWKEFSVKPLFQGAIDGPDTQQDVFVDYVPACSLLVRVEALKQAGQMDEGFFLYWDDIEWGVRMKKAGYKVMVSAKSKVWHKMGVANRSSALPSYYFWRNRLFFFQQYTCNSEWQRFIKKYALELYQSQFSCRLFGKKSASAAIQEAVLDGMKGKRGKREAGKPQLLTANDQEAIYKDKLSQADSIGILAVADEKLLLNVLYKLRRTFADKRFVLFSKSEVPQFLPVDVVMTEEQSVTNVVLPVQHVLWGKIPICGHQPDKNYWLADVYGNILPFNLKSKTVRLGYKIGLIAVYPLLVAVMSRFMKQTKGRGDN